jgi:hypothetical protein
MSLLLRADSAGSRPVSILGIAVPQRVAPWFARLWISAVIIGSLLPGSAKVLLHTRQDQRLYSRNAVSAKHRFVHFFAFGSSFLVLSLLATSTREELEAAIEILTIGCIIELLQFVMYSHRHTFEWWDVRDDAVGIAVAFVLVRVFSRLNVAVASRS